MTCDSFCTMAAPPPRLGRGAAEYGGRVPRALPKLRSADRMDSRFTAEFAEIAEGTNQIHGLGRCRASRGGWSPAEWPARRLTPWDWAVRLSYLGGVGGKPWTSSSSEVAPAAQSARNMRMKHAGMYGVRRRLARYADGDSPVSRRN